MSWPESGGQFELRQEERGGQVKAGRRIRPTQVRVRADAAGASQACLMEGATRASFPGAGQTQTIMRPSIHANHGLYFLKRAKKGLRLGRKGGLLKMPDKSDGDGDGKMWRPADFARWADPASACGAFAPERASG